ncbi:MAG: hypothetical protein ACLFVO_28130, partial [Chloroflexaceae bacterium]
SPSGVPYRQYTTPRFLPRSTVRMPAQAIVSMRAGKETAMNSGEIPTCATDNSPPFPGGLPHPRLV